MSDAVRGLIGGGLLLLPLAGYSFVGLQYELTVVIYLAIIAAGVVFPDP